MQIDRTKPRNYPAIKAALGWPDMSTRLMNCCLNHGIENVQELSRLAEADLLRWKEVGRNTRDEVKAILAAHGLALASSGDAKPKAIRLMAMEAFERAVDSFMAELPHGMNVPISMTVHLPTGDLQLRGVADTAS